MKFNNVIFELLNEEFANKKLLNAMLVKWYGAEPTEEQKTEGEFLITKFFEIKNRLNPKSAEVRTFLNKFEDFNIERLKEVTVYTLPQIKFIVGEYFDLPGEGQSINNEIPEVLRGRDLPPTPERIEASKSLWFGNNSNLILSGEGFRVYRIVTRKDSINFGYYQGYISNTEPYKNQPSHMQWCTTRHIENSNLYGNYRNRRTFYFVIDESKHPDVQPDVKISQYYLSALQFATDSPTNYRITSILNDGSDPVFTEAEIYQIYPQLRGNLDKIDPIEYNQTELGTITDELDRVDERDSNEYAFFKVNSNLKKRYIDAGKTITRAKSWETMSTPLKISYIDPIDNVNTMYEKFSTRELLDVIKSSNEDFRSVDRRAKIIGLEGFGTLVTKVMQTEFIPDQRKSISKGHVSLFENRRTKKFGIFNKELGEWLRFGGVQYDDNYSKIDDDVYMSDSGEAYIVEVYSTSSTPDDRSFYVVIPVDDSINGYFVSSKKWEELQTKLHPENGESNFEPEQDSDIQEKNKGV